MHKTRNQSDHPRQRKRPKTGKNLPNFNFAIIALTMGKIAMNNPIDVIFKIFLIFSILFFFESVWAMITTRFTTIFSFLNDTLL